MWVNVLSLESKTTRKILRATLLRDSNYSLLPRFKTLTHFYKTRVGVAGDGLHPILRLKIAPTTPALDS